MTGDLYAKVNAFLFIFQYFPRVNFQIAKVSYNERIYAKLARE